MYRIRSMLVWLKRWNRCRGFGIQSPWAYRFVRYVVNEHYPYYAYEELMKSVTDIDMLTRKLCRFYFRLANALQPHSVVDYQPETDAYATYIGRGCLRSVIVRTDDVLSSGEPIALMRMSLRGDYRKAYENALMRVDENTVIVVEGIYRNAAVKAFWKDIVADERTGVTFDLYYCGIIFFDKKRYKENFIINF